MNRTNCGRSMPLNWFVVLDNARASIWALRGHRGSPTWQFDLPAQHCDGPVSDLQFIDAVAEFLNLAASRWDFDGFILVADERALSDIRELLMPATRARLLGEMLRYGKQRRASLTAAAALAAARSDRMPGGLHA
jgi:hypothetical protein